MLLMSGRIGPFLLGVALLFGSGCSRSYDGTVIIPRPLDARRFWDRPPPNVDYGPSQVDNGAFPAPPQSPERFSERRVVKPALQKRHQRRLSSPAPSSSGPEKQLACRNVSAPGQRVRMVCD
ncbi:MAG: hypothetical protein E5Y12_26515 [Mesorhizobium sp.]|nr:hypothetical protein X742_02700 [Mesorhizobium sp. LNHC232B00]TIN95024.1 MAG: hypothetical protein E5Y06_14350 [Mesorhizobium sp.]TJU94752.1 MAG: hypothetical protein E5Y12_26515 [Mesorhizobium sp.]TJU97003.1 MAG: hypothetical protein E5Y08_19910 [Mesorhizobium sp.]TJV18144.1 MAG: hypothetical protein E5Y07_10925 [Mesorhizobium sp.]